jgi:ketosteroid isomerase-like protein
MKKELYKQLLIDTYELTGQGKLAEFSSYLADDVSWTESVGFPYAGTYIGPEAVLDNVHKRLGTEWEDFKAVPREFTYADNQVMVLGQYSGRYKMTQKPFATDFVHVYRFNDQDKVSHFQQIVDSVPVLAAMDKEN